MEKESTIITQSEFQILARGVLKDEVIPLLERKGKQYSKESAFGNFEQGSALFDITPEHYLMVMATKHWHNLCKNPIENVKERCIDIIIYMLLLIVMTGENNGRV